MVWSNKSCDRDWSETNWTVTDKCVCVCIRWSSVELYCGLWIGDVTSRSRQRSMCIRIHYVRRELTAGSEHIVDGYFHTFCSTGSRLFNNIVITLRTEDEARGNSQHPQFFCLSFCLFLWTNFYIWLCNWAVDTAVSHCLLLLFVWHAPLGVRSAKRRHQSPEWTILSHSYRRLIQGEFVWSQVLLDSLHPCSMRTSWWSPPVLQRGSIYDTPGICFVWHSCSVAEQRKTPCLDNSRQAWLPDCLSHLVIPHVMVPFDS